MVNEKEEKELAEEESFTNIVERFTNIINQFNIKKATLIADHCAKGNLEDLEDVNSRLREMGVHPSLVSQIVNFWADEINHPIPKRLRQTLDRETGTKSRETAGDDEDRIYTVDPDSGIIRLATKDEKATTLVEAKELQKLTKKDLEEERKRKKKEEKEEGGEKELPAFIMGEGGNWTLNPKAKIGVGELAIFQMYQESLQKGEPIDPIDELARREEATAKLKDALGVKAEDTEMSILDKLQKYGMLKGGESGLAEAITLLDTMGLIRKPSEGGESQVVTDLKQKIDSLNESVRQKAAEELKNEVTGLRNAILTTRSEFAEAIRNQSGKGEFDIMSQALNVLDRRLGSMEQTITGVFRKPPNPLSKKDRTQITDAITDELASEDAVEELGTSLFG